MRFDQEMLCKLLHLLQIKFSSSNKTLDFASVIVFNGIFFLCTAAAATAMAMVSCFPLRLLQILSKILKGFDRCVLQRAH